MRYDDIPYLTLLVWVIFAVAATLAVFSGHWPNLIVILTAFLLTLTPIILSRHYHIRIPLAFLGAFTLFIFATLFLGEIFDFYERYWWWDIVLHGFSAVGIGVVGFVFVFYLFQGDAYAAPPWALALIAFVFALAAGTLWEIFEFAMDELFGLNMQKSGLPDTMGDLIVDSIGALIAALSGFFWLKGRETGIAGMINEFVDLNKKLFKRLRERTSTRGSKAPKDRTDC